MKQKCLLLLALAFTLVTVNAQTKVTKTNIVSNWVITAVDASPAFKYDVDKDSLSLGEAIKSQVKPEQESMVLGMMKQQVGVFKKMAFKFNADGTAELNSGVPGTGATKATYTVDEANSTITTVEAEGDKVKETIKADFVNSNLRLVLEQPTGNIILLLKKG
ncbi:hypothetical protein [Sediminibacterium ginsengisoli]|uniref:Lipocalin-like domain-containing protein n=1 Tax=Sediminibacterium ginsengisoli TaxID=413434 RepID=A0A1T4JQZ4_9BACT|nr:hypothetical protein [Sediminibacterium ginsengisoli]SJZ32571.1 hypothetical protein SAMN04488132_10197 [Sediminibacterium ginsengisoli]